MKKIYFFGLLFTLAFNLSAQTTVWSEDFESYASGTGIVGAGTGNNAVVNSGDYPDSVTKWSLDNTGADFDKSSDWPRQLQETDPW